MQRGVEEGLGGAAYRVGGLFGGLTGDVLQPDEGLDAGRGPDGHREFVAVDVRMTVLQRGEGVLDPGDGPPAA